VDVKLEPETVSVLQELASEMGIPPLDDSQVKRLAKALYGLKQAPRQWYADVRGYLLEQGYEAHPVEECLFMKTLEDGRRVWVLLFVDDMICIGDREGDTIEFIENMTRKYDIKYLGEAEIFWGCMLLTVIEASSCPWRLRRRNLWRGSTWQGLIQPRHLRKRD
jgi:hypothetical protein